jgi:peptidoglycan/xylan/chitin deacetylase (PgdA/CDA1 family)
MSRPIASCFMRALGNMLSPGGARGRLVILIYHRILRARDPLLDDTIDAATFAQQMALLASNFNVLPLGEAVQRLARGRLPGRAACVTFDDGYADNHDVALPILKQSGIPATFFVATGFLDGGRMWNDTIIEVLRRAQGPTLDLSSLDLGAPPVSSIDERRTTVHRLLRAIKHRPPAERADIVERIASTIGQPLPGDLMMTRAQVRALYDAGMAVGGHTVTHPILTRISDQEAEAEMAEGKAMLEALIGGPVKLFAYPNGIPTKDFGPNHVALARRVGFSAAVTTSWGAARRTSDVFQLPRFTPWDRHPLKFNARLLLNTRRSAVEI